MRYHRCGCGISVKWRRLRWVMGRRSLSGERGAAKARMSHRRGRISLTLIIVETYGFIHLNLTVRLGVTYQLHRPLSADAWKGMAGYGDRIVVGIWVTFLSGMSIWLSRRSIG